jgi:TPR repeat protein
MTNDLPRNEKLPLFNPHRPDFTCEIEAEKVPPVDAEADKWFNEALALEDPQIYEDDRDYKKIVQLTRQAAQRHHWKAMLNLASLYLEGRDPEHGREDAIRIVEEAMKLGIPAAYDRMGTYHMEGIVPGGATTAYAFWQKAADMGSSNAMAFLGEKLKATWDNPRESFWANMPVARKMLECSFSQGNGEGAYYLHFLYTREGNTREDKARALAILHQGVKLGSTDCAAALFAEFDGPANHADMLAPFIDKARAERYLVLSKALDFNPLRRFPNLDKVLPLPPAPLPRWDGKRETLLKAAMAVTPPKAESKPSAASQRSGREHLDAAYDFRETDDITDEPNAPFAGYWHPAAPNEPEPVRAHLAGIVPGLVPAGRAIRSAALSGGGRTPHDSERHVAAAADRPPQPRRRRTAGRRRPGTRSGPARTAPRLPGRPGMPDDRHLAALACARTPVAPRREPALATDMAHCGARLPRSAARLAASAGSG